MSDIESLQYLSGQLKQGAQKFSSASQTLQQQGQRLDWSAQDLASGASAWAGQGSQNFTTSWNTYHRSTQQAATALNNTAQALTQLAQKIDETVAQLQQQQAQQSATAIGMGVLTVGLVVVDVLQLGLDPVTDGLTVAAGSADATAIAGSEAAAGGAEVAAQGLVEADAQIASDLDEIANGIDTVADSGDIGADGGGAPGDIPVDDGPFGGDGGSSGDGGGMSGDGGGGGDGLSGDGGEPPSSVKVYRVQTQGINERLLVTSDGNIEIQGDRMLFLNFNQESRALEFLARRGDSAYIVRFETSDEFLQFLRDTSVEEREARLYPDSPIRVDRQFPDQFGIRSNLFNILLEYIIPGSAEVIEP